MKDQFGFTHRAALLSTLAIAVLAGGCPFMGDCFPTGQMTVTIAPEVPVPEGATLCFSQISNIGSKEVTGTSPQGLPMPLKAGRGCQPSKLVAGQRTYQLEITFQEPDPTWYWAWID